MNLLGDQHRHILRGILPAVVTPIGPQGRFNPTAFEKLLGHLYRKGIDGVYVCGQTGEGLSQPAEQRKRVAEAALSASPKGRTVIVHVGSHSTEDALELARHASCIGATAVSSLPPRGCRRFSDILQYYRRLATVSDIPLLIYYFPELCSVITTAEQILQLCEIPNIIGLKFTDFNLFKLWQIKSAGKVIFNGRDEILAAGLLMGADGGIGSTYNLVPQAYVQLFDMAKQQRWAEAKHLQDDVNKLIAILLQFPFLPALKTILKWTGVNCGPSLMKPHTLSGAQQAKLRKMLGRFPSGKSPLGRLIAQ